MDSLAAMYRDGEGVEKDAGKAVKIWMRSIDKDLEDGDALYNLDCAYAEGAGVEKDPAMATELWQRASKDGDDPDAERHLAWQNAGFFPLWILACVRVDTA